VHHVIDRGTGARRWLEGSRRMVGGEDVPIASFAELRGRRLVVLERLDGSDASVGFDGGVVHVDGVPEALAWAEAHRDALFAVLGDRWVLHGQWMQRKRAIYYDALPAWFVVDDAYDRERGAFVAVARHRDLLAGTPVALAPVVHDGAVRSLKALHALISPSRFKTSRWREALRAAARSARLDPDRVALATDPQDLAAGLVVALEDGDVVTERIDFVRASFGNAMLEDAPDVIIDNALAGAP
jgi:hypothetical protein